MITITLPAWLAYLAGAALAIHLVKRVVKAARNFRDFRREAG